MQTPQSNSPDFDIPAGVRDIPDSLGVRRIRIRPGLDLVLVDGTPDREVCLSMETCAVPLEFSFHLAGRTKYRIEHRNGELSFDGAPGLNVASAFPSSFSTMVVEAGARVRMVALHMTPLFFKEYTDLAGPVPHWPELGRALDQGEFPFSYRPAAADPAMAVAAARLLDCPCRGMGRQMFYESQALELVALQLEGLAGGRNSSFRAGLSREDLWGLERARARLKKESDQPPSLAELARTAGMNHTKLNRGFKAVYGTTVFGFLRQYRLARSRALIEAGDMNLAQIAYAVGFSSPSHFARAFLGRYGIQPSLYLKHTMARKTVSLPTTPDKI